VVAKVKSSQLKEQKSFKPLLFSFSVFISSLSKMHTLWTATIICMIWSSTQGANLFLRAVWDWGHNFTFGASVVYNWPNYKAKLGLWSCCHWENQPLMFILPVNMTILCGRGQDDGANNLFYLWNRERVHLLQCSPWQH